RKLPSGAGDELADVLMSRYERQSTLVTSNRPIEDWAKLLGDVSGGSGRSDRFPGLISGRIC
ncbi:MAG: ATP-binding protein, partial [Steroidobacteraceae bacterium]